MATITRTLSKKINSSGKAEILLRVSVSRNTKLRIKSGVFVDVARFRNGALIAPRSGQQAHEDYITASKKLRDVENAIIDYCNTYREEATKEGAERAIEIKICPDKLGANFPLIEAVQRYIDTKQLKGLKVAEDILLRKKLEAFQAYTNETSRKKVPLLYLTLPMM